MSHLLCEGFNWPPLAVCAFDPVGTIGPSWEPWASGKPRLFALRVDQAATVCRFSPPSPRVPAPVVLLAFGDGQLASVATCDNRGDTVCTLFVRAADFQSRANGVGREVQSLSDMRGLDARSAQIGRPDGVVRTFQISRNNIQPGEAILACNLLAKDDWRATLADEAGEDGPEMALVFRAALLPRCAERLAGTTAGPNRSAVGPSSQS